MILTHFQCDQAKGSITGLRLAFNNNNFRDSILIKLNILKEYIQNGRLNNKLNWINNMIGKIDVTTC